MQQVQEEKEKEIEEAEAEVARLKEQALSEI